LQAGLRLEVERTNRCAARGAVLAAVLPATASANAPAKIGAICLGKTPPATTLDA
jgi:hypothetical protein